jgi:hypothetical protein
MYLNTENAMQQADITMTTMSSMFQTEAKYEQPLWWISIISSTM